VKKLFAVLVLGTLTIVGCEKPASTTKTKGPSTPGGVSGPGDAGRDAGKKMGEEAAAKAKAEAEAKDKKPADADKAKPADADKSKTPDKAPDKK
jgi:hypothetical protein